MNAMQDSAIHLIVVADDLGICAERDRGIFECLATGVVTSAVLLPNGLSSDAAAEAVVRRGLQRCVGLHLNITEGCPLAPAEEVSTLVQVDVGGRTRFVGMKELRKRFIAGQVDRHHIAREFQAQFRWFKERFGTYPRFVNGHQHCHISLCCAEVMDVLRKCGVRYIRNTEEKCSDESGGVPPLCPRCHWVSLHSGTAMAAYKVRFYQLRVLQFVTKRVFLIPFVFRVPYQQNIPKLVHNGAFVGLSFCKRVYNRDQWIAAIVSTVHQARQRANIGAQFQAPPLVIEAMVHPGYIGDGWDDFNASPEREAELKVMSCEPQELAEAIGSACSTRVALVTPADVVDFIEEQQGGTRLCAQSVSESSTGGSKAS